MEFRYIKRRASVGDQIIIHKKLSEDSRYQVGNIFTVIEEEIPEVSCAVVVYTDILTKPKRLIIFDAEYAVVEIDEEDSEDV